MSRSKLQGIVLIAALVLVVSAFSTALLAQDKNKQPATLDRIMAALERIEARMDGLGHRLDVLEKRIDDVAWFVRLGGEMVIERVRHTGPPPRNEPNPTAQGAGNPLKFYSYVFYSKSLDKNKKYPLLIFPHGGVHSNFSTYYAYIVTELVRQGYVVIATDYRGSTGYGRGLYQQIRRE